jgi:hypothetical protein
MNKVEIIKHTFEELDKNFEFLTLRNFHLIPEQASCDNDIDLLVHKRDYEKVAAFMQDLGYEITYDQGYEYLYGAVSHIHCVNREKDVHFDIVAGLYYRSLANPQIFVGGFEDLERSMWENKVNSDACWKYEPSIEDQLTHICSHSIFDKRKVTSSYENKIKELYEISDKERLTRLFEMSFFKVASHLLTIIKGGDCTNLFNEYVGYSQY